MKIAIIGNGKLSKKYGDKIDKYDCVIRFNKTRIEGFEKYVGTKTDILALVGETGLSWESAIGSLDRNIIKDCEYILFSGRKRNEDYEKVILRLKGEDKILFTYIGYDYYTEICKEINPDFELTKNPSTGINILCYILKTQNIFDSQENKLYIYGFDCFESGHIMDDEKRDNIQFHDLPMELAIVNFLRQFKNIKIYN